MPKLYSDFAEEVSGQQLFNTTVIGADIKFSSPSYEIGANKNNDGNSTYIRKNIRFPVVLNDVVHIRCDDITNAISTTPILVYQYDSNNIQIAVNSFTKATIIEGIDITPQSNAANVMVSLYPSTTGGLTDTYAVYTNTIIYTTKKNYIW